MRKKMASSDVELSIAIQINNFLTLIFTPFQYLFNILFFFAPGYLLMFSVSILVLTEGQIIHAFEVGEKSKLRFLRYFIYLIFGIYSIWSIGIFTDLSSFNMFDWSAIAFSIIAPICMIIVGKKAAAYKIKGKYKVFVYMTWWGLYFLATLIFICFYPALEYGPMLITGCVFIYCILSLFSISVAHGIAKGIN